MVSPQAFVAHGAVLVPRLQGPARSPRRRARPVVRGLRCCRIEEVEQQFREMGADGAADLVFAAMSADGLGSAWREVLAVLIAAGVSGADVGRMVERWGVVQVLSLDPVECVGVFDVLAELGIEGGVRGRLIAERPVLLSSCARVRGSVDLLYSAGMRPRDVRNTALKWPGLLTVDVERAEKVVDFLCAEGRGFNRVSIASLLRRAPWVLVYDVEKDIAPAIAWLEDNLLQERLVCIEHFVRASPHIFGTPIEALDAVLTFLRLVVRLDEDKLFSVVRSFPPILTLSVEGKLNTAANYLLGELCITPDDFTKCVRAFPAILSLDVDEEMRTVVKFFRSRGVINVGRIVSKNPPILGLDLDTDIIPKMEYVEQVLGLTAYDVIRFPGYFSYSLSKCIEPRTRFLQAVGRSVTEQGLNMALAPTDEEFCERIAKVPLSQYYSFRNALFAKRAGERDLAELAGSRANTPGEDPQHQHPRPAQKAIRRARPGLKGMAHRQRRKKRRLRATDTNMPWSEELS